MRIKNGELFDVSNNVDIKNGEFTIPCGVTSISDWVFSSCRNLKSIPKNYKAFKLTSSGDIRCRDYIYHEGEWSDNEPNPIQCIRGYHYCTNLFDIFNYYYGILDENIAIYECEVGDVVIKCEDKDSKCVTNKIKPVKRLYRQDVIRILNGATGGNDE